MAEDMSAPTDGLAGAEAPEPDKPSRPDGAIPSAMWVHYDWDRPIDLKERGAGFIEGFASACASLSYVLCHYPDGGKSYDPMKVDLQRGTMHSYVFNMRDGGRSHSLADYSTYQDIANVLFAETIEAIADESGICSAVVQRLAEIFDARRAD